MVRARIVGTGHFLPEGVVTNFDLEKIMDTSDEWIRQRTGILRRHKVEPGVGPSDLATEASLRAMESAGIGAADIDFIICATCTADYLIPSSACLIQDNLGVKGAGAMDINAACSGFLYGLEMADAWLRVGKYQTVLVVGAEVLSARTDYADRNTAVLFGDGAGAVVVRAEEGDRGILSTYTNSDGSLKDILAIPAGGTRQTITPENVDRVERNIIMDGQAVYKRAVLAFGDGTRAALEQSGLEGGAIDLFVPHQANKRIIDSAARRLGIAEEKVYLNLDKVANTSAASIPIALDQAVAEGKLQEGLVVLMAAFGAGLTWASAIVRW